MQNETRPIIELAKDSLQHYGWTDKLKYHRGNFYLYRSDRYVLHTENQIKIQMIRYLQSQPDTKEAESFQKFTRETMLHLKGITHISDDIELNSWMKGSPGSGIGPYIPLRNGILDIGEMLNGGAATLLTHSPDYFSTNCLPYDYEPTQICFTWDKFLEETQPDKNVREFMQEWFGLNLIPDTSFEKFVIFHGSGANGKSVTLTVLKEILGHHNVTSIGIENFNQSRTFPLAATEGKLANIVGDMNEIKKTSEGLLKKFVSGESITVERKFKDPFELKPTARLTLATNILPRISDRSQGIARRVLVVDFSHQILNEADQKKHYSKGEWWRAQDEFPGILNWALAGLVRLMNRKHFIVPDSIKKSTEEYMKASNPANTFLLENFEYSPQGEEFPSRLAYQYYQKWSKDCGYSALGAHNFAEEVKRAFPLVIQTKSAKICHLLEGTGNRTRNWIGLRPITDESDGGTGQ